MSRNVVTPFQKKIVIVEALLLTWLAWPYGILVPVAAYFILLILRAEEESFRKIDGWIRLGMIDRARKENRRYYIVNAFGYLALLALFIGAAISLCKLGVVLSGHNVGKKVFVGIFAGLIPIYWGEQIMADIGRLAMKWRWLLILLAGLIAGALSTYLIMRDSGTQAATDPAVFTAPAPMDPSAPADTPRYELQDAEARGLIKYEVQGMGNSSGASLIIGIQRLAGRDIDVYVVPGTIFKPSSDGVQQMVALGVMGFIVELNETMQPATSMYLPAADVRVYILEAYCLNFELANPASSDIFRPVAAEAYSAPPVDVRAAQIMYEGKRRSLSVAGIQTAIWADRDHRTKQEIQAKFNATDQEMDAAFDMLKNMPPPRVR